MVLVHHWVPIVCTPFFPVSTSTEPALCFRSAWWPKDPAWQVRLASPTLWQVRLCGSREKHTSRIILCSMPRDGSTQLTPHLLTDQRTAQLTTSTCDCPTNHPQCLLQKAMGGLHAARFSSKWYRYGCNAPRRRGRVSGIPPVISKLRSRFASSNTCSTGPASSLYTWA